jgi:hypothetical protein
LALLVHLRVSQLFLRDNKSFIAASISDAPAALFCHYPQSLITPDRPSRNNNNTSRVPVAPSLFISHFLRRVQPP